MFELWVFLLTCWLVINVGIPLFIIFCYLWRVWVIIATVVVTVMILSSPAHAWVTEAPRDGQQCVFIDNEGQYFCTYNPQIHEDGRRCLTQNGLTLCVQQVEPYDSEINDDDGDRQG